MRRFRYAAPGLSIGLGLAIFYPHTLLWAQTHPDAGRLLEQNRPAPELPAPPAPEIDHQDEAPIPDTGGPRVPIRHIEITGNSLFPRAELQALLAGAEGKELTLAELRGLAGRITRYYREHGYLLARAYLPTQTVQDGVVDIAVVEGRLGTVAVDNRSGLHGGALAPLSRLQRGEPAQAGALERSLLLLSDLPGTAVHATLRPGTTEGSTDLLVDVAPGRRLAGSLEADNFGDRYSGRNRVGGSVQFNNPLKLGDQASLRLLSSGDGLNYARAVYQFPVSAWGTRLGIAGSWMHYALGDALAPLQASGEARTTSAYALQPLARSRRLNLNAQIQFDHVALRDRIVSSSVTIDRRLDRWIAGFSGDARDGTGGGGLSTFSLTYTTGRLKLDPETSALDAITAETAGSYGKANFSWQRLQRLTASSSLYASIVGQIASKNLDSSEKLWLGGPNAVRAYPQGEAPGDEGYLFSIEARHQWPTNWPGQWQLTAFFDHGHVRTNKQPWTSASNSRSLSGAGLGLNIGDFFGWTVRSSLAWPTGNSGGVTDPERKPRLWLQAVHPF